MSFIEVIVLVVIFFIVSIIYSSSGFGGGSSYLAILAFFPLTFYMMRTTALICNLVVVTSSVIHFVNSGGLSRKVLNQSWPFIILSVPASFLAGFFTVNEEIFFVILGMSLLAASVTMFVSTKHVDNNITTKDGVEYKIRNMFVGGILGTLAGLVGIGGGIFLSPYLHISNWSTAKRISIVSTLFIMVNSAFGLMGNLMNSKFEANPIYILLLAGSVFLGGKIGVTANIKRLSNKNIRMITAFVIFVAGINVLRKLFME